jgi:hypothetical protein
MDVGTSHGLGHRSRRRTRRVTDGCGKLEVVHTRMPVECLAQPCHALEARLFVAAQHQDAELIAADADDDISPTHARAYYSRNRPQEIVAELVSARIVCDLEVIHIEDSYRRRFGRGGPTKLRERQCLLPGESVAQTGEWVGARLLAGTRYARLKARPRSMRARRSSASRASKPTRGSTSKNANSICAPAKDASNPIGARRVSTA